MTDLSKIADSHERRRAKYDSTSWQRSSESIIVAALARSLNRLPENGNVLSELNGEPIQLEKVPHDRVD